MVFMPICSLDGEIEGSKSIITFSDEMEGVKDSKCYVHFFSTPEWISVDSGNCEYFCGTNGFFDGLYLKQKTGCKPNKISRSRKKVKQLYERKTFDKAYAVLSPVLKKTASESQKGKHVTGHQANMPFNEYERFMMLDKILLLKKLKEIICIEHGKAILKKQQAARMKSTLVSYKNVLSLAGE